MALKDDPKVVELVEKASAKAAKEENKRVTTLIKEQFAGAVAAAKDAGDKAAAKALGATQKEALAAIKL